MPDELVDIVNDANIVIYQEMRSVVHQHGLQHRGVHVFLFTRDGNLLVQQRSQDKDTFPLALDCSVSEHLKAGEDYYRAALRGLKEELGVKGIEILPVMTFRMCYGPNDNKISQLYQGIIDPAVVHFDPIEIERIAYYSFAELLSLLGDKVVTFSRWFEQLILWRVGKPSELTVLR